MKSKGISRQLLNSSAPWRSKRTPTRSVYRYQGTVVSQGKRDRLSRSTFIRKQNQPPILKKEKTPGTKYLPQLINEPSILYMDADLSCRAFGTHGLLEKGYNVIGRSDTEDLYSILNTNEIFLIILDIMVPGRESFQLLRELKEDILYKNIPIIITSDIADSAMISKALACGADWYLVINSDRTLESFLEDVEELIPTRYKKEGRNRRDEENTETTSLLTSKDD
ncbi:MAG: response regulator [Patescibacteria group bacterium]|jgi:PleD family two-component response regulator